MFVVLHLAKLVYQSLGCFRAQRIIILGSSHISSRLQAIFGQLGEIHHRKVFPTSTQRKFQQRGEFLHNLRNHLLFYEFRRPSLIYFYKTDHKTSKRNIQFFYFRIDYTSILLEAQKPGYETRQISNRKTNRDFDTTLEKANG